MIPVVATLFEMISELDLSGHLFISLLFYSAFQPMACWIRKRNIAANFGDGVLVAMLGWGACYLLSLVFGVIYLKSVVRNGVVTASQHDLMTAVLWLRSIIPAAYAAHFSTKE
jgi:hypothetical protein